MLKKFVTDFGELPVKRDSGNTTTIKRELMQYQELYELIVEAQILKWNFINQ